jgi:hypothetical protein
MFRDELQAAIEKAPPSALNELSTIVWRAHRSGQFDDDTAQRLAELVRARQVLSRPGLSPIARACHFRRARRQHSPDRAASIARRRQLAAACPMPPALAANFTCGELAVHKVIADDFALKGYCDRSVAEIAARAGVCETVVRNATRAAADQSMISVLERRRPGAKNLTNIIRIIRAEWKDWIAKRRKPPPASPIGCKKVDASASNLDRGAGFKDRNGIWRPKVRVSERC